jgi:hypothetical protein
MRDNQWLNNRLEIIWKKHFKDVPRVNIVNICFGKRARTRLGSIKQSAVGSRRLAVLNKAANCKPQTASRITITGYFRDEIVPEYVVDLVIAHELCHYAHGFCSPHPQLYDNPHKGKIIDKELYKRGFGEDIKKQKTWLKESWPAIVGPHKQRRIIRKRKLSTRSIIKLLFSS